MRWRSRQQWLSARQLWKGQLPGFLPQEHCPIVKGWLRPPEVEDPHTQGRPPHSQLQCRPRSLSYLHLLDLGAHILEYATDHFSKNQPALFWPGAKNSLIEILKNNITSCSPCQVYKWAKGRLECNLTLSKHRPWEKKEGHCCRLSALLLLEVKWDARNISGRPCIALFPIS